MLALIFCGPIAYGLFTQVALPLFPNAFVDHRAEIQVLAGVSFVYSLVWAIVVFSLWDWLSCLSVAVFSAAIFAASE